MSDTKPQVTLSMPGHQGQRFKHCDETAEFLHLASLLSPRDLATISVIVRRAGEIFEAEGEDIAIAVLDQVQGILRGREPDA